MDQFGEDELKDPADEEEEEAALDLGDEDDDFDDGDDDEDELLKDGFQVEDENAPTEE